MAQLVAPDETLIREPNLLIPGRKPVGPVKIDWSHPLARGLSHFVLFNEQSPRDLVTGKRLVKNGDAALDRGSDGFLLNETNAYLTLDDVRIFQSHTIFTNIDFLDNDGTSFQYFLSTGNFAAANSLNLYLSEGSAARANTITYSLAMNQYIDVPYWPAYNGANMAFRKRDGFSQDVFYNGVNVAGSGGGTSTIDGTSATLYIGCRADVDSGRMTGGTVRHLVVFGDRALSASEIAALHRDPYQFLIPA